MAQGFGFVTSDGVGAGRGRRRCWLFARGAPPCVPPCVAHVCCCCCRCWGRAEVW